MLIFKTGRYTHIRGRILSSDYSDYDGVAKIGKWSFGSFTNLSGKKIAQMMFHDVSVEYTAKETVEMAQELSSLHNQKLTINSAHDRTQDFQYTVTGNLVNIRPSKNTEALLELHILHGRTRMAMFCQRWHVDLRRYWTSTQVEIRESTICCSIDPMPYPRLYLPWKATRRQMSGRYIQSGIAAPEYTAVIQRVVQAISVCQQNARNAGDARPIIVKLHRPLDITGAPC